MSTTPTGSLPNRSFGRKAGLLALKFFPQRQEPIMPSLRWRNRPRSARIGRSSMATGNLETLTLEFENARAVQALYGGDDKLLRELEATLNVRVASREGWLRI